MAKGFSAVRKASEDITERKNSGGSFGPPELWPGLRNSGDAVIVRFLEQGDDVASAWMHEYKIPNRQKSFFTPCLDQDGDGTPCPGCEQGLKQTFKGFINVIWRNSPQLERNSDGRAIKNDQGQFKVAGYEDEVVVWMQGITVFEDLADKDIKYRGLCTRDFEIRRRGSGLNTKYIIDPVLDDQGNANAVPMNDSDLHLAANKYDVETEYTVPKSYDETAKLLSGSEQTPNGGGVQQDDVQAKSPFDRDRANRFLPQN